MPSAFYNRGLLWKSYHHCLELQDLTLATALQKLLSLLWVYTLRQIGIILDYNNIDQIREAIVNLRDNPDVRKRLEENGPNAFCKNIIGMLWSRDYIKFIKNCYEEITLSLYNRQCTTTSLNVLMVYSSISPKCF
jgi:hypothetical protein